ncbi:MAG: hypothetical protein IJ344_04100 [Clostridia bacterium]|nr:hypothetical protein [Clostridia bacterium]
MTNLEKLRQRSLEEVARDIYENDTQIMDEICEGTCCTNEDENGVADCLSCVKRWLLKEAV